MPAQSIYVKACLKYAILNIFPCKLSGDLQRFSLGTTVETVMNYDILLCNQIHNN